VVVVERAVTEVPRPTLFDIVIVWEDATVGRLVKISSSSVLPSLQLPTEKVNLKSFASMRERELQELNIKPKLLDEETTDTLRAGTLVKEKQAPNVLFMFVTAAVFNRGIVVNFSHPINMPDMFVTAAVLNNGTAIKLRQVLSMLLIFVTAAVFSKGIVVKELQP
jgi:hypothetical protein